MVKKIGTLGKMNAILLNIKIKQTNSMAILCDFKLAANGQNFTEKYLA